jgi:hypothetical protein
MGEAVSAVVSQQLQQVAENQSLKQNSAQSPSGKSFDTHLQEKMTGGDQTKTDQASTGTKTIEQIQAELQKTTATPPNSDLAGMTQFFRDLMNKGGGRMSILRAAQDDLRKQNAVSGGDLKGTLISTEKEWNAVQQIMSSDKDLSQGELLALQQRLYMVSQHVEVMSKVVDQMAGGIKTVLNTNI